AAIAQRTGISLPTVQRFFAGNGKLSFETVEKITNALGMSLSLKEELPEEELIIQRAKIKAHELAKMVQATSSLEKQGLNRSELEIIEKGILRDLLKGSKRNIWNN